MNSASKFWLTLICVSTQLAFSIAADAANPIAGEYPFPIGPKIGTGKNAWVFPFLHADPGTGADLVVRIPFRKIEGTKGRFPLSAKGLEDVRFGHEIVAKYRGIPVKFEVQYTGGFTGFVMDFAAGEHWMLGDTVTNAEDENRPHLPVTWKELGAAESIVRSMARDGWWNSDMQFLGTNHSDPDHYENVGPELATALWRIKEANFWGQCVNQDVYVGPEWDARNLPDWNQTWRVLPGGLAITAEGMVFQLLRAGLNRAGTHEVVKWTRGLSAQQRFGFIQQLLVAGHEYKGTSIIAQEKTREVSAARARIRVLIESIDALHVRIIPSYE